MNLKMENKNSVLRNIPQVEKLLQNDEIRRFIPEIGHGIVVKITRKVISAFRDRIENGNGISLEKLVPSIIKNLEIRKRHKLQRVINGTGVIIHTFKPEPTLPLVLLDTIWKYVKI